MRELRLPLLFATVCAAGAAFAQAEAAPSGAPQPQTGFFAPQSGGDPSLFHTLPPEVYEPKPRPVQPDAAQPAATPPLIVVLPDPNRDSREQIDRTLLEAQQARLRTSRMPAPINGAFTGSTDERDR